MGNNNECRGRLEHLKKKPHDRPVTPDEMNRMPGRENHAKRTRLGKIFSLGRGLYQSVLYPEPVHYQDRDTGEWREIDNTLIPMTDGAGETYLINRSNDELRAEFHNTADAAMVLLENEEGRMVSWQLEDARDIQPRPVERQCPRHEDCDRRRDVLDHLDGEVVFEGILPGVDIRCRVQSVSFKDDIIFFTRQSARPLSFLLSVPDMVPSLKENGDIQIIAPTGDVPFVLPAPFMKDSTTEGAFGGVLVTLAPTGERDVWRMTYTPDEVWLDQAQFPVVLDPAVISKKHSSAIEDNFITSYSPNTVQPYAGVGMKVSYNNGG